MKVIDLLNKIANGEEVPHVQYDDVEAYLGADGYLKDQYGDNVEWWIDNTWLNHEVEVIEDTPKEDKKIEKLEDSYDLYSPNSGYCTEWTITETILKDKINEIIDRLNGDSDE